MKIAIPVAEYRGLDSLVYGHFGSAPLFVLVDSEAMSVEALGNPDHEHEHGQCNPMRALAGAKPEAVVVGGIGTGAVLGLRHAGIRVYRTTGGTVADAISSLQSGDLEELTGPGTCAGHGEDSGCSHHLHGH